MKFIIDGEVQNNSVAESMMSKIAYDLAQKYELCVILNRYDDMYGVYHVTIHEFIDLIDEFNLEPLIESDEFEDGYPVEYAISDVLHALMSKIWE